MNALSSKEEIECMDCTIYRRIQSFLFYEARILDSSLYREWLKLLDDDIHYYMPVINHKLSPSATHDYSPNALAYFDDTYESLAIRVEKLSDRTAWTENPPTRQSRIVSNIEVRSSENQDEFVVHSSFLHHRGMGERDSYFIAGRREDVMRVDGERIALARRLILIDQHILLSRNLNVFF